MLKNAFKKHPLQNRINVQIKGGGGQTPFEQCSKKLHFSYAMASLILLMKVYEVNFKDQILMIFSSVFNPVISFTNHRADFLSIFQEGFGCKNYILVSDSLGADYSKTSNPESSRILL